MDDDEDIHDRLERLEATVADQQQTIEQLTEPPAVGRRSVVASLLGAGALGGLAGYGSQSARAQASGPAGTQGTEEEPNDMFAWDLDVQNGAEFNGSDVTGVGALEADNLRTPQTGVVVQLDGSQTFADGATTTVEWATETSIGEVSDLLDTAENAVVIPEGFGYATVTANFRFSSGTPIDSVDFFDYRLNGSTPDWSGGWEGTGIDAQAFPGPTMRQHPVTEGDEISCRLRMEGSDDMELANDYRTWMGVWMS